MWRDRIWVLGGFSPTAATPPEPGYPDRTSMTDVWSTADGIDWQQMPVPNWQGRVWPAAVVHNDVLYLIGGYDGRGPMNLGDVWRTTDGVTWTRLDIGASFSGRHFPTAYSNGDHLFVAAGNAWPVHRDT